MARQRVEPERGYLEALRIAGGLVLRPAERGRDALRERIGLALSPVVAQAEDHEIVPGDELVLAGEDGIDAGRRTGRGRSRPSLP